MQQGSERVGVVGAKKANMHALLLADEATMCVMCGSGLYLAAAEHNAIRGRRADDGMFAIAEEGEDGIFVDERVAAGLAFEGDFAALVL